MGQYGIREGCITLAFEFQEVQFDASSATLGLSASSPPWLVGSQWSAELMRRRVVFNVSAQRLAAQTHGFDVLMV